MDNLETNTCAERGGVECGALLGLRLNQYLVRRSRTAEYAA
jgi:hypothetical protein